MGLQGNFDLERLHLVENAGVLLSTAWHRQNKRAGFRCWTKPRIAHDRGDFHQQQTWNFNAWLVLLLAVTNQLCWYVFLPQILAVYIPSFKKKPFPSRTPALALNENSVNHPSKFLTFPPEIFQSIIRRPWFAVLDHSRHPTMVSLIVFVSIISAT